MDKHRDSYCLFGAKSLLNRLQNVAKEIDGVRKPDDIERIHDMRVATRRMRSALALFEKCLPGKKAKAWNKQMRRVTRALGAARDADVQMDHSAIIKTCSDFHFCDISGWWDADV